MHYIYNLLPKSLLTRFILIIVVPSILMQSIAIYTFYDKHWYNVVGQISNSTSKNIALLYEYIKNNDYKNAKKFSNYNDMDFYTQDKKKYRSTGFRTEEVSILEYKLNQMLEIGNIKAFRQDKNIIVTIPFDKNRNLIIKFSDKPLITPTTNVFVIWIIFVALLLLAITILFARNQIKSILFLTNAINKFGNGITNNKLYKPSGAREIRQAGIAFIKMSIKITKRMEKQAKFLAMVSHDLRTPLTRLKLQLSLLNPSKEIDNMNNDIKSMQSIITSYLDFAQGKIVEDLVKIDLCEFLGKITQNQKQFSFKFPKKEIITQVKLCSFTRAIENIINNATKYATLIQITVYKKNNNAFIDIEDNGPGIPKKERQAVFEAFSKLKQSKSDGVGLGLTIAKEIIEDHMGSVTLEDGVNLKGLLVKIKLKIL